MTWDLPLTQTSLSLDENVRAKEGGTETVGETALRLPSVPFPWSLAAQRVVQYSEIDSIGVSGDKKGLHWYQWYDWYQ